jgi:hypothetical protein
MEKKLNLENANGETMTFVQDLVSEIYGKTLRDQAKDLCMEQQKYYALRRHSMSNFASKKALKELLRIHPAVILQKDVKGFVNFAQSSPEIREFAKGRGYHVQEGAQEAPQSHALANNPTGQDLLINRLERENAELRKELLKRNDLQRTDEELTKLIEVRKQQLVDLEELRMEQKRQIKKVFTEQS